MYMHVQGMSLLLVSGHVHCTCTVRVKKKLPIPFTVLPFRSNGVLSKRNGDFRKRNGYRSHRLSVPFTVGRCRSDARAS